MKPSVDVLERQLRRNLNLKRTKEFFQKMYFNFKEEKLRIIILKSGLARFKGNIKSEAPYAIAKRLKRFKK